MALRGADRRRKAIPVGAVQPLAELKLKCKKELGKDARGAGQNLLLNCILNQQNPKAREVVVLTKLRATGGGRTAEEGRGAAVCRLTFFLMNAPCAPKTASMVFFFSSASARSGWVNKWAWVVHYDGQWPIRCGRQWLRYCGAWPGNRRRRPRRAFSPPPPLRGRRGAAGRYKVSAYLHAGPQRD